MLQALSRKALFQASPFADTFVADMQQSYAQDFDLSDAQDRSMLRKYYDHLKPFRPVDPPLSNDMVILTFPADHQQAYFAQMPLAMAQLLEALGSTQLYFVDFLKTSLEEFPFETYRKRNQLKRLLGGRLDYGGFRLSITDLPIVWPLFYFSGRYERTAIVLIADGEVPLALRLCKDGNFHCHYQAIHEGRFIQAAEAAGFNTGDVNLCWDYKVWSLPRTAAAIGL